MFADIIKDLVLESRKDVAFGGKVNSKDPALFQQMKDILQGKSGALKVFNCVYRAYDFKLLVERDSLS